MLTREIYIELLKMVVAGLSILVVAALVLRTR